MLIEANGTNHFRKPVEVDGYAWLPVSRLRFIHSDFDERRHPQPFGINLRWANMLEQDRIETLYSSNTANTARHTSNTGQTKLIQLE